MKEALQSVGIEPRQLIPVALRSTLSAPTTAQVVISQIVGPVFTTESTERTYIECSNVKKLNKCL